MNFNFKQDSRDNTIDAPAVASSSSSHDSSSNKQNGPTSMDENVRTTLARSETQNVKRLRFTTFFLIFIVAVAVCVLMFILAQAAETDVFRSQYDAASKKLADSFHGIVDRAGSVTSVANVATTFAYDQSRISNQSWPFMTVTSFEKHSSVARFISGALHISLKPLVTDENRDEWEAYVTNDENKKWIGDGLIYNEYLGVNRFEHDTPPLEQVLMVNITRKPITHHHPEHYDVHVVDEGPGPYLPMWQSGPVLMKAIVNENNLKEENEYNEVEQCLQNGVAVFGHMQFAPVGTIDDTHHHESAFYASIQSIASGREMKYLGDPMSKLYIPILDQFSFRSNQPNVVGVLVSVMHWNDYLNNILPSNIHGLTTVLENSCDGYYTFTINGNESVPIGHGDLHQRAFGKYERTTSMYDRKTVHDGSLHGLPLDHSLCRYQMHTYPSEEFYNDYQTKMPIIISISVALCFLFLITIFLVYNRVVETRQRKVLDRAVHTTAIVSELFPKDVRDRLIMEQKEMDDHANGIADDNNLDTGFMANDQRPFHRKTIANLFPDCTILFADIAGFTAWSSTRDPDQVFILLQTIFQSFDEIARRRKVFKVETIGDSYVAATGLPTPQHNHAIIMARFSWECKQKMNELMKQLEVQLGPDCSGLKMRLGLHSGPVVAGVLRGDRARFQLFGDTVNTASRMESTGVKDKIHVSAATASILEKDGKGHWLAPREDVVEAKGKGILRTYWLKPTSHKKSNLSSSQAGSSEEGHMSNSPSDLETSTDVIKENRLVNWMVDLLAEHIKQIMARQIAISANDQDTKSPIHVPHSDIVSYIAEVKEVIPMVVYDPMIDSTIGKNAAGEGVLLDDKVMSELLEFVSLIYTMYREDNAFHNFQHACHVTMSVNKLMKRITSPQLGVREMPDMENSNRCDIGAYIHSYTYGISSDPLAVFAIVFSALIHDVDHRGCSNAQLIKEEPHFATRYKNQSVAEQNSLDLSWNLLVSDRFCQLRRTIFGCQEDLVRFRQILINAVLATDIFDKELNDLRKARWDKAFRESAQAYLDDSDRKATIVMEHVIQASDVAHTMQHWHVYIKWNQQLFREMYAAYQNGRMQVDPSTFWYDGELQFFDAYVIPLAKKLKECQVFGVSSDEYLTYANNNRAEWLERGQEVVATYMNQMNSEGMATLNDSRTTPLL